MPPSTIKAIHQDVVHTLVDANARLLDASRVDENGRFVQTLLDIERCVRYAREKLQDHIAIDAQETEDDDL